MEPMAAVAPAAATASPPAASATPPLEEVADSTPAALKKLLATTTTAACRMCSNSNLKEKHTCGKATNSKRSPAPGSEGSNKRQRKAPKRDIPVAEKYRILSPKGGKDAAAPAKKAKKGSQTYQEMMLDAVVTMNERTGSSAPAIVKWIGNRYPDFTVNKNQVSAKLKMLVADKTFIKVKSSYKISPKVKDQMRKNASKGPKNKLKKSQDGRRKKHKDGMDIKERVRQHLGLIPIAADHARFNSLTEPIPKHTIGMGEYKDPIPREQLLVAQ